MTRFKQMVVKVSVLLILLITFHQNSVYTIDEALFTSHHKISQPRYTGISDIAWSPDGNTLVVVGPLRFCVYSQTAPNSFEQQVFSVIKDVRSIAYNPNGQTIALGYEDGHVQIRDATSLTTIANLDSHTGSITVLTFNSDGSLLASNKGRTIQILDTNDWSIAQTLEPQEGYIGGLDFSSDGDYLVSGNGYGHVHVWETENWTIVATSFLDPTLGFHPIQDFAFSADDNFIAITHGGLLSVHIWSWRYRFGTGSAFVWQESSDDLEFSPTGDVFAASRADLKIWRFVVKDMLGFPIFSVEERIILDSPGLGQEIEFSPDGKYLAVATSPSIYLWEVDSGDQLYIFEVCTVFEDQ